jgi:hypothetical protein
MSDSACLRQALLLRCVVQQLEERWCRRRDALRTLLSSIMVVLPTGSPTNCRGQIGRSSERDDHRRVRPHRLRHRGTHRRYGPFGSVRIGTVASVLEFCLWAFWSSCSMTYRCSGAAAFCPSGIPSSISFLDSSLRVQPPACSVGSTGPPHKTTYYVVSYVGTALPAVDATSSSIAMLLTVLNAQYGKPCASNTAGPDTSRSLTARPASVTSALRSAPPNGYRHRDRASRCASHPHAVSDEGTRQAHSNRGRNYYKMS